jgi:hypothetical protein
MMAYGMSQAGFLFKQKSQGFSFAGPYTAPIGHCKATSFMLMLNVCWMLM